MRDVNSLKRLATAANEAHEAARTAAGDSLAEICRAGEALRAARRLCPRGGWRAWLIRNFRGSVRTAQRYVRVSNLLAAGRANATRVSPSPTAALRAARRALRGEGAALPGALIDTVAGDRPADADLLSVVRCLRAAAARLELAAPTAPRARYALDRVRSLCDDLKMDIRATVAEARRFVYFIEAVGTGRVKIGSARDPVRRLSQLSTGSAVPLVLLGVAPGGFTHEWCLRRRFASTHLAGEWFQSTDELRAYVKAVAVKQDAAANNKP